MIDGWVVDVYARAQSSAGVPCFVPVLARRLLGVQWCQAIKRGSWSSGLKSEDGKWQVAIDLGMPREALTERLAHAIALWYCAERGLRIAPALTLDFAVEIVLPAPAMLYMRRDMRFSVAEIARVRGCSLSLVERRLRVVMPSGRSGTHARRGKIA